MINEYEKYRDSDASQAIELEIYYALVRAARPRVCVEVGTHRGLSGLYIATALRDNGFGHLHTCDPKEYDQQKTFDENGLHEFATYYQCKGEDMQTKDIDFLFIDGYHEKEWVEREITALFPNLSPHALVLFHDAAWAGGVNEAAKDLPTFYIDTPNGIRVFSK